MDTINIPVLASAQVVLEVSMGRTSDISHNGGPIKQRKRICNMIQGKAIHFKTYYKSLLLLIRILLSRHFTMHFHIYQVHVRITSSSYKSYQIHFFLIP